jgi:hypothetical protein
MAYTLKDKDDDDDDDDDDDYDIFPNIGHHKVSNVLSRS